MTARLLPDLLYRILKAHPAGLSEHALIVALREHPDCDLEIPSLQDPEVLFRIHFLLFNALYRLQEHLHAAGRGRLRISALQIQLLPWREQTGKGIGDTDPLRDYYLDMGNLERTGRAEVERLLDSFWRRFARFDQRGDALKVLGLPADADEAAIRHRYRKLAMEHHPDRGGDTRRLQEINAAADCLLSRRGR